MVKLIRGTVAIVVLSLWTLPPTAGELAKTEGISEQWLASAVEHIKASEYELRPYAGPGIPGGSPALTAPNRANGLWVSWDGEKVTLSPQGDHPESWHLSFRLSSWQRNGEVQATGISSDRVDRNIIHFDLGAIRETLTNDRTGVQVELVVPATPAADPSRSLSFEFDLAGTAALRPAPGGGLELLHESTTVAHFDHPQVVDAAGRELEATMGSVVPHGVLRIEVDTRGARFPVTITSTIRGPALTADWSQESTYGSDFGFTVGTAGDVNIDGYSDVVIGAPGYGVSGSVFVYHGSSSGLPTSPSWQANGEVSDDGFGLSVGPAGDVDGNSFGDLIVGAPFWDQTDPGFISNVGKAYVYCGGAGGLSQFPCWSFEGIALNDNTGMEVSTAGDMNGDGYSDVLVNAYLYDWGGSYVDEGIVYYFYGSSTGLPPTGTTSGNLSGPTGETGFGWAVAAGGDINGDGYSDVLVGSPYADYNSKDESGVVRIFWGGNPSPSSLNDATELSDLDTAGAHFGYTVATAGDINGDGYSDFLVGAPSYTDLDPSSYSKGRALLYMGGAPFQSASLWWADGTNLVSGKLGFALGTAGDVNGDGYSDFLVADHSVGDAYLFLGSSGGVGGTGLTSFDWVRYTSITSYGFAVASAGDVNGDGYSDFVIGAPDAGISGADLGYAELFYGSPYKPSLTPAFTDSAGASGSLLGYSVSSAGDVNGDGYADVILGAPYFYNGYSNEGAIFVWHGGAGGPSGFNPDFSAYGAHVDMNFGQAVAGAGDVNGDGYDDILVGAPAWGSEAAQDGEGGVFLWYGSTTGIAGSQNALSADWMIESNLAGAQLGNAVTGAGDVNGDGYADVVAAAKTYSQTYGNEGAVFMWYGSSSGLPYPGIPVDWFRLGQSASANLGHDVAAAGDVNGDGFADIVVSEGGTSRVYVHWGSPNGPSTSSWDWMSSDGSPSTLYGFSVAGMGDVNGDGYSDIVVGEPWYSGTTYTLEGRVWGYCGQPLGFYWCFDARGGKDNSWFGWDVAGAGDVNGDGFADALVSAPYHDESTPGAHNGRAYLYWGSSGGLGAFPAAAWVNAGAGSSYNYGQSVASAGDVNGDGFADLLIGVPGAPDGGEAHIYSGNSSIDLGWGRPLIPRQMRAGGSGVPVAHQGGSDDENAFDIQVTPYSPAGRAKATLLTEVQPLGTLFDDFYQWWGGTVDTGTGSSTQVYRSGLTPGSPYHWRARLYWDHVTNPFLPRFSRWFRQPWGSAEEMDIHTAGRPYLIFQDGFETGDTTRWTLTP